MKITLFKKYLALTLCIVLVSFIILGVFLMTFVGQYWRNYEFNQIKKSIDDIDTVVTGAVEISNGELSIKDESAWELLKHIAKSYEYDILLTDYDGKVVETTRIDKNIKVNTQISEDIINHLAKNKYYEERSAQGNFYEDTQVCVGEAVMVQVGATETNAGYIIVCSANYVNSEMPFQIFMIFIYAVVAALIISIVLAGLFSYRMSKPLKEMSRQAKKIAKGDFSGRMTVKSKDELGQLTLAFNDMAEALEKEEIVRRDFIANISHELKTPMTTIAGFIDGILDGTIPPARQSHYLAIVSEEIGRLSRLVASMLSLARIDSGKTVINKTSFSMLDIIVSILMTFEDRLESKGIEIEGLDTFNGLEAYGDQTLLHQVMYNLIENAVKFTPENGTITIKGDEKEGKLCFSVSNTGKGISPEDLPFIFDKFYKADKSRSEDKKSMGLGLYIVKTIVNLHGGELSVTSELDGITCFSGWIPEKKEK
jgi:signal transduction histidine kinase